MTSATLYRGAGAALLVCAATTVLGFALHPAAQPAAMTGRPWVLTHALLWVGAVTAVAGLVGLFVRQRTHVGMLGAAGTGLACMGLSAMSGAYYFEAVVVPALAADAPTLIRTFPSAATWSTYLATVAASGALIALGFMLLGTAMYRAGVLPRWATLVASTGAIAAGAQFLLPRQLAILAITTLGIGLAGLGYALWASAAKPTPPTRGLASELRLADASPVPRG